MATAGGQIVQNNFYYPFGMLLGESGTSAHWDMEDLDYSHISMKAKSWNRCSEMNNKNLTIDEALVFYEWSNAVRISQESSRSRVSRMRKRINDIYQKYSENRKARKLIRQMNRILEESLRFGATAATILPII